MKKMLAVLSALCLVSVCAVGCGGGNDNTSSPIVSSTAGNTSSDDNVPSVSSSPTDDVCEGEYEHVSAIEWTGFVNGDIEENKTFNVRANVSVLATVGSRTNVSYWMNITTVVSGATLSGNLVSTVGLAVGAKFTVTYTVNRENLECYTFATDVVFEKVREITIVEATSNNLVVNGDFADGLTGWGSYGGQGTLGIDEEDGNNYAYMDVRSESANSYEPRINTDTAGSYGLYLVQGTNYQLTFRAKAAVARPIFVQVGEILPVDPWFNLVVNRVFNITTAWEEYTLTFEMTEATNPNEHLVFECGTVSGQWAAGKVSFDDISVEEYSDEIPDETLPVFSGVSYAYARVAASGNFDLMDGVSAIDDRDGDITDQIAYDVKTREGANVPSNTISLTTAAKYTVTYSVSDVAGNEAIVNRKIDILSASEEPMNLFGDFGNTVEEGVEADAKGGKLGQFVLWTDPGNAGTGTTITNKSATITNKALSLTYTTQTTNAQFYAVQLFYKSIEVSDAAQYNVEFDITSAFATNITVNGQVVSLTVGTTHVKTTVMGSGITLSIQMGESAAITVAPSGTYVFSNFQMQ